MWVPNLFLLKLIENGLETKKYPLMQHIQAGCLQLFILICFSKKDAGKFVSLDSLMLWRQKKPWKCNPEAPKTELNYDEHKRPSLTPSKVITVIHAPITLFFAIDAQFNIYINGQITHWTDG